MLIIIVYPTHHLCEAVVAEGVDLDPLAVLGVGLVLVPQGDAGVGTTQLCRTGGEGRDKGGESNTT